MKVAVISDIHANLPALEGVLSAIDDGGVDQIWCLGDAVGYGARPNECVDLLARRCSICLLGNHDLAALEKIDISVFSTAAADAARWTVEQLSEPASAWLAGLESSATPEPEIGLYHGSPRDPVWEYVTDSEAAEECLTAQERRVSLIGHSHIALFFTRMDEMSRLRHSLAPAGTSESLQVGQWLINPGSVGQPRDGDPRAAWLELETESLEATYRRIEYDVEAAAEQIRQAGLPEHLADRLFQGH